MTTKEQFYDTIVVRTGMNRNKPLKKSYRTCLPVFYVHLVQYQVVGVFSDVVGGSCEQRTQSWSENEIPPEDPTPACLALRFAILG
jgi:hypothetical protein